MAIDKITASGLGDGGVSTADIADGAVTAAKLDSAAVTPTAVSDTANTSTGGLSLPSGTTAQRPSSPDIGESRMNTTNGSLEYYDGNNWISTNGSFKHFNKYYFNFRCANINYFIVFGNWPSIIAYRKYFHSSCRRYCQFFLF